MSDSAATSEVPAEQEDSATPPKRPARKPSVQLAKGKKGDSRASASESSPIATADSACDDEPAELCLEATAAAAGSTEGGGPSPAPLRPKRPSRSPSASSSASNMDGALRASASASPHGLPPVLVEEVSTPAENAKAAPPPVPAKPKSRRKRRSWKPPAASTANDEDQDDADAGAHGAAASTRDSLPNTRGTVMAKAAFLAGEIKMFPGSGSGAPTAAAASPAASDTDAAAAVAAAASAAPGVEAAPEKEAPGGNIAASAPVPSVASAPAATASSKAATAATAAAAGGATPGGGKDKHKSSFSLGSMSPMTMRRQSKTPAKSTLRHGSTSVRKLISGPVGGGPISSSSLSPSPSAASVAGDEGASAAPLPPQMIEGFPHSKRSNIALEIYTTERSYVASLQVVQNIFVRGLRAPATEGGGGPLLEVQEVTGIFSNVERILEFNSELLHFLHDTLAAWDDGSSQLGAFFRDKIPGFKMYAIYCNNYDNALNVLGKLAKKRRDVQQRLDEIQANPRCGSLNLQAFLLLPVQRIPRYVLLLKDMLKKTPEAHPDLANLQEALVEMEELADYVNSSLRAAESQKKMQNLRKNISGLKALESPTRLLLREGPVCLMSTRKKYQCVLFNDVVVFAKDGTIELMLELNSVWFEDLHDLDPQTTSNDAFELYNPDRPYTVYAGSSDAKKLWIGALKDAILKVLNGNEKRSDVTVRQTTYTYKDGSVFVGEWNDSARHGKGKFVAPSKTTYEGDWVDNEKEGAGAITWHTGERYSGQWQANRPHGLGTLTMINGDVHVGGWAMGRKHGPGRIVFANGDTFEGTFDRDQITGHGVLVEHGGRYEGEWAHSQRHGRGVYVSAEAEGWRYEGEWRHNNREGEGMDVREDGTFTGHFQDNMRHGFGRLEFRNGDVYEGNFFSDHRDGDGTMRFANGDYYQGRWRGNARHGFGTQTWADGRVFSGDWADDLINGRGTMVFADKSTYEGDWENGKRHGSGTFSTFGQAPTSYEGQWVRDKHEGFGVMKYADGSWYEGNWKAGMRHGTGRWGGSGNNRYVGDWSFGRKHGKGTFSSSMGTHEGFWRNDMMDGHGRFTNVVGTVVEGQWKGNRKVGKGVLTYASGQTVQLEWKDGRMATVNGDVAPELPSLPRQDM